MSRRESAILAALVVGTVFALATFEASDSDLGFHLATGRAILQAGHLLDHNVLTFAEPDHPWVLQQGIPAVLFELAWRWGGIAAVILFKASVVALTFLLVFLTGVRLRGNPIVAAIVTITAAWSCAFRFVERPLIFSNLALAAVGLCLAGAFTARRERAPRWLAGAALAIAVACNLHAGAVFSFLLVFGVAAAVALEPAWRQLLRQPPAPHPPTALRAAGALLLAAAAGAALALAALALYHPFPLRVLETPFAMGRDSFLAEHLIEFRRPWRFPFEMLWGYWLLVTTTCIAMAARWRRLPLAMTLAVLAFLVLSLRFVRLADAFAIVAAPVLTFALEDGFASARWKAATAWLALAMVVIATPINHWSHFSRQLRLNPQIWPTETFAFVRGNRVQGPAFVSDGWAGPYLHFFYPPERVYFFTSFDAFSPELYRTYMDIRYGKPGWDVQLDRSGVEVCILKYTSPNERLYQKGADNLRQLLTRDPRWALVYFDDMGEVFVRKDGINREVAQNSALDGVDPDAMRIQGTASLPALAKLQAARAKAGLSSSRRLSRLLELARHPRMENVREAP